MGIKVGVMINFIICEDNKIFNQQYVETIKKLEKEYNIQSNKHIFYDYNKDFFKIIKSNLPYKIYILDIVVNSIKGTEIAKKIREKDKNSLIIFITSFYDTYKINLLENMYMFLRFIDKKSNYLEILYDTLKQVIFELDKQHILTITHKNMKYIIDTKDILFLYYEDRKVNIITKYQEVQSYKSLKYFKQILNNDFCYSHKACLVNIKEIKHIDKKNHILYFENDCHTRLVSDKYLKEIENVL